MEIAQTEGHSLVVQEDATGTKRMVIRRKEEVDEDYEGLKHGEMPSAVRLTKIQKDEVFLQKRHASKVEELGEGPDKDVASSMAALTLSGGTPSTNSASARG